MNIRDVLATLFFPGQLVELRAVRKRKKGAVSLYYDNHNELAKFAQLFSDDPAYMGTYCTLQEVDRKILAEPRNILLNNILNLEKKVVHSTENPDVKSFRWFLIDCDPSRPDPDSSSTKAEKQIALDVINKVHAYLAEQGWPEPVFCDSGNGWHLLYRINLSCIKSEKNPTPPGHIVRQCLHALSSMFSIPEAKIDTSVFKPAQLAKLYGTMTRKGVNTTERPWRASKMKSVPKPIELVPLEKIHALAALCPLEQAMTAESGTLPELDEEFNIQEFCKHYGLAIDHEIEKGTRTYYVLDECPIAGRKHTGDGNKTALVVGDTLGFECWSDDCNDKKLSDLLAKLHETHPKYPGPLWEPIDLENEKFVLEEVQDEPEPEATPRQQLKITATAKPSVAIDDEDEDGLKYPELKFPYEALPEGVLKKLVDKACEGGLSPGLVCPAILTFASAIPAYDVHVSGSKINMYATLLSLVAAGKDTAIDRARAVLGLNEYPQFWSNYTPSGEASIAFLIGDKKEGRGKNTKITPGPRYHCIVTYELRETLKKSASDTSGVLETMCWFWDHNDKLRSNTGTGIQKVECRTSWLTCLPVGQNEIDRNIFRMAFGEGASHGIADRMLFGFAEEKFDSRQSMDWEAPYDLNHFETEGKYKNQKVDGMDFASTRVETLVSRLMKHKVTGWADGVKELYMQWEGPGRSTYHLRKLAVLTALINGHVNIEMSDYKFAVEFMEWRARILKVFTSGTAQDVSQGQFSEMIEAMISEQSERWHQTRQFKRRCEKVAADQQGCEHLFVRWKQLSNDNRWFRYGRDVEKSIDQLVRGGTLAYLMVPTLREGRDEKTVWEADKSWVRLA